MMPTKTLLSLIILLSVWSCSNITRFDFFRAELFNTLITASQIDIVEAERFDSNLPVVRPPLAWVPLFKATVEDKRGRGSVCLFFRTPHRKQMGTIKLVELDLDKQCNSILDPSGEISRAQLDGVKDLMLFTGRGDSLGFEISLTFQQGKHERKISLPLFNIRKLTPLKRFATSVETSLIPGTKIAADLPLTDRILFKGNSLIVQKGDDAISCHRVNSSCETVEHNICNRCRFGWFPGASGVSCPQGGTKYCRPNRCGERGMPACPRGIDHRRYKIEDVCIADSPAAFCRDGLRVVCNEKKEFICL